MLERTRTSNATPAVNFVIMLGKGKYQTSLQSVLQNSEVVETGNRMLDRPRNALFAMRDSQKGNNPFKLRAHSLGVFAAVPTSQLMFKGNGLWVHLPYRDKSSTCWAMSCHDGGNEITLGADTHHNRFVLSGIRIILPANFMGVSVERQPLLQEIHEATEIDVPLEHVFLAAATFIEHLV